MSNTQAVPLLEIDEVSRSFGAIPVLKGINLTLRSGEAVALVGENGAGKSTLMRIVGGYLPPSAGEVRFAGTSLVPDMHLAERLGISMVHQEFALVPDMTVAENIFLGREPTRGWLVDRAEMRRAAGEALRALNCDVSPDRSMKSLPIATWQMVELAKAFESAPRVLLMDEPTAVLGRDECEALFRRMETFRAGGGAILFTSHRLDEVRRVADRVAVLRDGRITLEAGTRDASEDEIATAMVGRELSDLFPPRPPYPQGAPLLAVEGLDVPREVGAPIRDAGFTLRAGEILGVAGLVGSGRTELFEGLVGLRPARARRFTLRGEERALPTAREAWRLGLAYLTEDRKARGLLLGEDLSLNLALTVGALSNRTRIDQRAERAAFEEARLRFDIRAARPEIEAGRLSGGNQQKLLIAKTLASAPEVVIFDEPTRGVDIGAKQQIYRVIADLAAAGHAIVVISSEMIEVIALAHRIMVLDRGRVAGILDRAAGDEMSEETILRLGLGLDAKDHSLEQESV